MLHDAEIHRGTVEMESLTRLDSGLDTDTNRNLPPAGHRMFTLSHSLDNFVDDNLAVYEDAICVVTRIDIERS